jgi:hypothetical protein
MAVRTAVVQTQVVTTGLISMLATATARPCGDHGSPPDGNLADGYTYVNLIPGGEFDGPPLWSPESDATLVYQVTSVGLEREHVEWIADRVRLTMTSRLHDGGFQVAFPVLVGMLVIHRAPDGAPPGVIPEGPPESRVYNIPERYRISVVST